MNNSALTKLSEQILHLSTNPIIVEMQKFGECHLFGGYIRSVLRNETPKDTDIFVIVSEITDTLLDDATNRLKSIEHIVVYNAKTASKYTDCRNQIHKLEIYDTNDDHTSDDQHILTRKYDILFATSPPSYIDFDVNSICIKISGSVTLQTSTTSFMEIVGNSFSKFTINQIIQNINDGQFNIMQSVASFDALSPTELYLFIRRIGARIENKYQLMSTQHNINVALMVLKKYNGFEHVRSGLRRTITMTIAHLIMFVKTTGTFADIEKLIAILRRSKRIIIDTLNYNIACNQMSDRLITCAKLCNRLHNDMMTL